VLDAAPCTRLDGRDPDPFQERNAAPCGRYWAVVHTHPQAERWACSNLQRRGYRCFLPLCLVRRRDRATPSLWHTAEVPLFPRYAFVEVSGPWTPIRYCQGVHDLLMTDGYPGIVAKAEILALQAVVADRAMMGAEAPQWAPGAPVALLAGALRGHPAVVLDTHGEHATLAVLLFGALRQVVAPVAWLVERQ
jgi:transcription antitermination factor NusG